MFQINLHALFATVSLGLVIAAATPFYAVLLTVGWAWRLWVGVVNLALSFAIHTRKATSIG